MGHRARRLRGRWPSVCFTVAAAREVAGFATAGGLALMGIGLDERHHDAVLAFEAPGAGEGSPGIREALLRSAPLAPGGTAVLRQNPVRRTRG